MTKGDKARFTFRLPSWMFDKLKEEAEINCCSVNSFLIGIIRDWLKANEKK